MAITACVDLFEIDPAVDPMNGGSPRRAAGAPAPIL